MVKRLLDQRRAVALTRVSTDEKRQELGAEAQRQAIESWAKANHVEIVAWHGDEVSGTCDIDHRPGLVAAVADMTALDAGTLLVQKADRLARDPLVALLTERDVERHGGRIVTADGIANGGTPADQLMRTVLGAVGRFEVQTTRQRIKAALAVKRSRGERLGGAPYGFRATGEKGARVLVEHPEEQATLTLIRKLSADGLTVRGIAAELERRGVLGRVHAGKRRPLGSSAVHALLKRHPGPAKPKGPTRRKSKPATITPAAVLRLVKAAQKPLGRAFIPAVARKAGCDVGPVLLALSPDTVELSREDFPDELSPEDRALCPDAHDGWPLSYARVR